MSDDLNGTFICPLCGEVIPVTVSISTVPMEIDGSTSFTVVAAPQYTHTCPDYGNGEKTRDG